MKSYQSKVRRFISIFKNSGPKESLEFAANQKRSLKPEERPAFARAIAKSLSTGMAMIFLVIPLVSCQAQDIVHMPFDKTADWGNMTNAFEWNRHYSEYDKDEFIPIPEYNRQELTIPFDSLVEERTPEHNRIITEKLFYSTKHFGIYNMDYGEYSWNPNIPEMPYPNIGLDLKQPFGMPVKNIAVGVVHDVVTGYEEIADTCPQSIDKWEEGKSDLRCAHGNYVEVLFTINGKKYIAVYMHLDGVYVQKGQPVDIDQEIGTVGMSGGSTGPHLSFQIDVYEGTGTHIPYFKKDPYIVGITEKYTVEPISFIQSH